MLDVLKEWLADDAKRALLLAGVLATIGVIVALVIRRRDTNGRRASSSNATVRGIVFGLLLLVVIMMAHVLVAYGGDATSANQEATAHNIFWTVLVVFIGYFVITLTQRALLINTTSIDVRHRVRSNVKWIGLLLLVAAVALIWMRGVKDVGMIIGLVGAGLALALQETLLCIAGWVLIIATKPFDIGDRVQIGTRIGDVIDVGLFQTSMLEVGNWVYAEQSTGRMLIVPNSVVFRDAIFNYTKGFPFIWNEFSTVITFESDWKAAKAMMVQLAEQFADTIEPEVEEHVKEMQRRYAIRYGVLTPAVYTDIAEHGVRLTLRYLTAVRNRRGSEQKIAEGILDAFLRHPKIDLAYPTTRMYRNDREGKPTLGGAEEPRHDQGATPT